MDHIDFVWSRIHLWSRFIGLLRASPKSVALGSNGEIIFIQWFPPWSTHYPGQSPPRRNKMFGLRLAERSPGGMIQAVVSSRSMNPSPLLSLIWRRTAPALKWPVRLLLPASPSPTCPHNTRPPAYLPVFILVDVLDGLERQYLACALRSSGCRSPGTPACGALRPGPGLRWPNTMSRASISR